MKCFSLQACCPSSFTFCRTKEQRARGVIAPLGVPAHSVHHLYQLFAPSMSVESSPSRIIAPPVPLLPDAPLSTPATSPYSLAISGSWQSWNRAPAPYGPSAQHSRGDALLVAYRKVTSHLVPGRHHHHQVTKASFLHLHPGTSACRSHLKFPIFLNLPSKKPAPPQLSVGSKHQNGYQGAKTQILPANCHSMARDAPW